MAKHRRYSRKRSQRRNHRASKKMRGGVDINIPNSDMSIDFETAIPPGSYEPSQDSLGNISFDISETGPGLDTDDLDVTQNSDFANTTVESLPSQQSLNLDDSFSTIQTDDMDDSIVGDIDEFDEPDTPPFGGKRRKRKTSKRRTNKRKSKKTNKTRKHRRKSYRGGAETFTMTTQNNMSPYDNQNDKDTAVILAQKLR
jgi:hypothetical protein